MRDAYFITTITSLRPIWPGQTVLRTLGVTSLALESPPLLNAILAFAAKHINAVSLSASRENTSMMPVSFPDTFQQRAMKFLAREIHELAIAENSRTSVGVEHYVSRNRSNAVLATMLVLCNVETVWPGQ